MRIKLPTRVDNVCSNILILRLRRPHQLHFRMTHIMPRNTQHDPLPPRKHHPHRPQRNIKANHRPRLNRLPPIMRVEDLGFRSTRRSRHSVRSAQEALGPERLHCVDRGDLAHGDGARVVELLEEGARGGDFADLNDYVEVVVLGARHPETRFGVAYELCGLGKVEGEIGTCGQVVASMRGSCY